jgi:hypothetical protein
VIEPAEAIEPVEPVEPVVVDVVLFDTIQDLLLLLKLETVVII